MIQNRTRQAKSCALRHRVVVSFAGVASFVGLAIACGAEAAAAGAMERDVEWVRPRIGQRGTTVEVVIQGMHLKDPREIVFQKPGIRATSIDTLPNLERPIGGVHGCLIEEQLKAVLRIDPDCEPGEHPFRLRTAHGLSLLATFHVTPFPVVAETTEPNDTIATAQSVEPNVTVLGTVDTDVFQVPAAAGSRLSVEVDCVRIADVHYGDSEFDLAVRILDETGHELATNDDNALHVQDPLVSLKLPDDLPGGHVFIELRQSIYKPASIPYAIHIGTFRRPLAAYPAGGRSGEPLTTTLLGDPLGDAAETVAVPATPGTFSYFGEAPSPLSLRSSPFGNLLEDRDAAETRVPKLPIAVNGTIEKLGDTDVFRLAVKKGDRYRVRVYGSHFGHPIDPAIRIWSVAAAAADRSGAPEVEADDSKGDARDLFGGVNMRAGGGFKDVLDPSVIWEPPADGDYLLEIFDASGGGGPTAVYRIEIETPPQTRYFVLASRCTDWVEGSRATGLAVPQGGRWTVPVSLYKGQGTTHAGPFDIVAKGLPDGVRLVSSRVPGNATEWPVQLVADTKAMPGGAVIRFEAVSADPAVPLGSGCQQSVPFINHAGGDAWRVLRIDRFAIAVTEPAPIAIDLVPPTAPLVRGGELFVPVKLTRRPGYDEPVEFQADFAPPGVGLPPKDVIPSGSTEAVLRISAERNAPLGKGPLYVMASTVGGNDYLGTGRIRVSSQLVEIEVVEPFVELAGALSTIRRGGRANVVFAVTAKTPFEGEAQATLLGLPKGVTVSGPPTKITKDSKQIAFEVEATDDALLGPVNGLECELVVKAAGQEIRQRAGKSTLRIDPRL